MVKIVAKISSVVILFGSACLSGWHRVGMRHAESMMVSRLQKPVIFTSKADAERETGHFSVFTMKITSELGGKISRYLGEARLRTWIRQNKAQTSDNEYTIKFCLRRYQHRRFDILEQKVTYGDLKRDGVKPVIRKYRVGNKIEKYLDPNEENVARYKYLSENTPTLTELYFWICRKYPRHILAMGYNKIPFPSSSEWPSSDDDFISLENRYELIKAT